ncbi:MAG TPA: hypothetical protein VHJ83_17585, partial [Micromonosporaceae bacterium]|nr:hypothetical protein [Micromonosporaceae bacterium]
MPGSDLALVVTGAPTTVRRTALAASPVVRRRAAAPSEVGSGSGGGVSPEAAAGDVVTGELARQAAVSPERRVSCGTSDRAI